MARLQTFAKDLQLATAGLSPQAIAPALAAFARSELAKVIADGTGSAVYDKYVNGVKDADESTVTPPGPIVYDFVWWGDIVQFALQYAIERSPIKSGRYRKSWFVMVDGNPTSDFRNIGRASRITIVNDQPYHRKIDVGHMRMSVPPGVVEDTRRAVMRIWGNLITAKRTMIQLPGGYTLKGHFTRGIRPYARRKLQKDTKAGSKMTYPCLVLEMKV